MNNSFTNHHRVIVMVVFFFFLLTTATARSRYLSVKFAMAVGQEQKEYVDSVMRAEPGVFSVSWCSRHRMLVVVYDRTRTSQRHLRCVVRELSDCRGCHQDSACAMPCIFMDGQTHGRQGLLKGL